MFVFCLNENSSIHNQFGMVLCILRSRLSLKGPKKSKHDPPFTSLYFAYKSRLLTPKFKWDFTEEE